MQLTDKAFDLGRMISESDEFKQLKQLEEALRKDEAARNLLYDLQNLRSACQRMEMSGQPLSEDNRKEMDEAEQKAMGNQAVRSFYEASFRFNELMQTVNANIQGGIQGKRPQSCSSGG